jgi:hypothetical protein
MNTSNLQLRNKRRFSSVFHKPIDSIFKQKFHSEFEPTKSQQSKREAENEKLGLIDNYIAFIEENF